MTLTKSSSTFVKYYFPSKEPEGGGSSCYKWKLFAVCLIKADKLVHFSLYLLVGLQTLGNQKQILLFSIVLANPSVFKAMFVLNDLSCPIEVETVASVSAVAAKST